MFGYNEKVVRMAKSEGVTIQSVVKAANILDFFIKKSEMGISEIAQQAGMSTEAFEDKKTEEKP